MKRFAFSLGLIAALCFSASARAQSEVQTTITWEDGAQVESRLTVAAEPFSALAPDVCTANATTLCLNNGRFQARAIFSTQSFTNAPAQAVPLTSDTGYFWFFSANNVEITLKVVDGRAFNNFFWAFYAALSDVAYTITITDMDTGAVKTYSNMQGSLASVADVTAFPGGSCSYGVSAASPASFGSGGGTGTVAVTAGAGCTWSAASNSSFVTITSGSSGSGNGTVSFSVAPNSSSTARTGSLTVAGRAVSISQSGATSGGNFDGTWSGTTSQGRAISFTIANNRLQTFSIGYSLSGGGCTTSGTSTVTYSSPPSVSSAGFVVSIIGVGNPRLSFNATVDFDSTSSAHGSASFTFTQTSPLPACNATASATFTLTKS